MENINNDLIIEKMLVELKEHNTDRDRLIEISKTMMNEYKLKIEKYEQEKKEKEEFVLSQISGLLEDMKLKETKTQFSYKLPSGQIIKKKAEKVIKLNKDVNKNIIPTEFLKVETSVNWMELKKTLAIDGELIVNKDTGEIIDYCSIETKPEEMKIKL